MTCTMRACALTLLAMARDAWAFVAAVQLRGSRPAGATCASAWFLVHASVWRDVPSRGSRGGVETRMLADSMLPTIARHAVWVAGKGPI